MTTVGWILLSLLILPVFLPVRLARRFRGIETISRAAARRPYLSAAMLAFGSFCLGPLLAHFSQPPNSTVPQPGRQAVGSDLLGPQGGRQAAGNDPGLWPYPTIHDEFSYLLAADTYAHARLASPPHPMWKHFESMHILQQPTYASKYPPAQGIVLAIGQHFFDMPIVGVWLNNALATLAAIWMLRGWMPHRWAFFGAFLLAVHPLMILWGQCYWGGSAAVLGGCLLIGAWPRLAKGGTTAAAFLGAAGIAILANSRPYEGLVLTLAIAGCLLFSWLKTRVPGFVKILVGVGIPCAVVLVPTAAGMAYLNYQVTGHIDRLPYQEHARQYAAVPPFLWQAPYQEPEYRHAELKELYGEWEADSYREQRTLVGFLLGCRDKLVDYFRAAYDTPLLFLSLLGLPWVIRSQPYRLVLLVLVLFVLALLPETYLQKHYAAPAAGLVNLLCVQGLRYIRCLRRPRPFVGRSVVRLAFVLSLISTGLYVAEYEQSVKNDTRITLRQNIETSVLKDNRKYHLIIVHYGKDHDVHNEWVYNAANIDRSRIVWARDMGEEANKELRRYFRDREVWQVDVDPVPNTTRLVKLR